MRDDFKAQLDFNHILHADCDAADVEAAKTEAARVLSARGHDRVGSCHVCEEDDSTCDRNRCLDCGATWCIHCETARNNGYAAFNACPACLTKKFESIKSSAERPATQPTREARPSTSSPATAGALMTVTNQVAALLREGKAPVHAVLHVREKLGWNLSRAKQLVAEQAKLVRKQRPQNSGAPTSAPAVEPKDQAESSTDSPPKDATAPAATPAQADEEPRLRHKRQVSQSPTKRPARPEIPLPTPPAGASKEEDDAEVSSVTLEARFLAMRTLRLLMALGGEVGVIFSFLVAARSAMWLFLNSFGDPIVSNTGKWYLDAAVNHPLPSLIGWAAVFIAAWCLMYGAGMPYRYSTTMPGLSAKRCSVCRVVTPEYWHCANCNSFRGIKAVSLLIWTASLLVTLIFIIVDTARFILNAFLWWKKS